MQINATTIMTTVKEYFLMVVGMFLYSFGWLGCIVPAGGVGGGATGFSLVICTALNEWLGFNIQLGTMVFLINGLLLIAAGFLVGWNFGIKTLFSIVVLSVAMNFWQTFLEGKDLFQLQEDAIEPLLAVILGGILAGLGVALCLRQGGSTGGVDIVVMIINKFRTVSYGRILIIADFSVIGSSLLVGYELPAIIYGYVMTVVVGYTVDIVMAGNQQSNQILIFTPDYENMRRTIVESAHRGVTLLDSEGGFSREKSKVVMVVCRKRETPKVLNLVKSVDPNAFISVGSVMGVYGKGFEALSKI